MKVFEVIGVSPDESLELTNIVFAVNTDGAVKAAKAISDKFTWSVRELDQTVQTHGILISVRKGR